jgi:SAM-dependent methyltransferase
LKVEGQSHWEGFQRLWRTHSDQINKALLSRWLPEEQLECTLKTDLFDEAVHDGLIPSLAHRTRRLFCIDVSFMVHQMVKRRYPDLQTVSADVRRLPFKEASFDSIVSNSTLDHFESMEDLVSALKELRRVLQPGGQLILTLDNPTNPIVFLRNWLPSRLLAKIGAIPYYVGKTLGARRLKHLLDELGFQPLETDAILHCPRILAVIVAGWMEKHASHEIQRKFLSFLMGFEKLSKLPTRFLTGYFVAVRCRK